MNKFKFYFSGFNGSINDLKKGIKEGYDINEEGLNLLINVIKHCPFECDEYVDVLINNGININQKDEEGRNALFYATLTSNIHLINQLIVNGIDINAIDKDGNNALSFICSKSVINPFIDKEKLSYLRAAMVERLIKAGINVTTLNNKDESALDAAVIHSSKEVVEALAKRGVGLHKPKVSIDPVIGIQDGYCKTKLQGLIYKIKYSRKYNLAKSYQK